MTTKISISVPDDVAEWLAAQENTSAAIADVVRAHMQSTRTDVVLRRAGFDVTDAGKMSWKARLEQPIPERSLALGREMLGRRELDAAE
jgi:hypothetical protein